jgi:hypothetical protein
MNATLEKTRTQIRLVKRKLREIVLPITVVSRSKIS